ncbi:MAG TPA: hypothetical protein VNH38_06130 [Candidatus Dormibacteraeota bacterium]|nr:hypothetical protein [Candidatus Dormibacteraeota bacterium]
MSLGAAYTNPYEVTALQIAAARAQITFRSRHRRTPQQRLAASDLLLEQVERCRLQASGSVAGWVFDRVVALTNSVDPGLRVALGLNRDPDHVGHILFLVQARLMRAAQDERCRGLAPVIPLFPTS